MGVDKKVYICVVMKKYKQLSQEQRYTIAQLFKQGATLTFIAATIGVHKSTVSREMKRNRSKRGYSAANAQMYAQERKEWRCYKTKLNPKMIGMITHLIRDKQWSPEQIAGRAPIEGYPMVGKTTIYTYLHKDKRDGGDLYLHTRHALSYHRRDRLSKRPPTRWEKRKSIEERPNIVNEKVRIGDFEMDTIVGKSQQGVILTLVDRVTGYTIINSLPNGKRAKDLARIVNRRLAFIKRRGQLHSITTDNGSEFTAFKTIERALNVPVFFARPYCSTDKPYIELTNKLIRQYIPKKSSFNNISHKFLAYVENQINNRPRKSLNFRTPFEVFILNLNCCT